MDDFTTNESEPILTGINYLYDPDNDDDYPPDPTSSPSTSWAPTPSRHTPTPSSSTTTTRRTGYSSSLTTVSVHRGDDILVEVLSIVDNTVADRPPPYEQPPAYRPGMDTEEMPFMITCQVCGHQIELTTDNTGALYQWLPTMIGQSFTGQYLVKCGNCHEKNPIKPAPVGKKFIRCSCNNLLVYRESRQQLLRCSRKTCRRRIDLSIGLDDINDLYDQGDNLSLTSSISSSTTIRTRP
ncbi:uncharacterized protein LOC128953151 [Oppia nitens]|uniref:uncharacterized protein LOC128953151 n=1 Tax=Oppia nitens TaxID=1686743 RepID=UPI0023DAA1C8|nr:uncharacterized protein LOC128953151 [Oppia nitens]